MMNPVGKRSVREEWTGYTYPVGWITIKMRLDRDGWTGFTHPVGKKTSRTQPDDRVGQTGMLNPVGTDDDQNKIGPGWLDRVGSFARPLTEKSSLFLIG